MILRPAGAADAEAVHALDVAAFGEDAWSLSAVVEELTGPRRTAVVACDADVVGFAVTVEVGDAVDLQRIVVEPSCRRRGLARQLLAAVAAPGGPMMLEVSATNAAAIAFYEAEGFTEVSRRPRYYRDGSDAVVLRRG